MATIPCPTCNGGRRILGEERVSDPRDNGDESVRQVWKDCQMCNGAGTVEVPDDDDDNGRRGGRR